MQQKNNAAAKEMYRASVNINFRKRYEITDAQLSYLKLVNLYFLENNMDSAKQALLSIRQCLDSVAHDKAEVEWNKLMWKYADKQHDITNAYKYLFAYLEKNDALQKIIKASMNSI